MTSRNVLLTAPNNLQLCFALGGNCPNINSLCSFGAGTTCGTYVNILCRNTKVGVW
jgi:hypothetical protein